MDNAQVTPQISIEQLMAMNAELKAQVDALVAKQTKKDTDRFGLGDGLNCKVSEKGSISVYGIHSRFPVTLYKSQWLRLFAIVEQLKAFIEANDSKLSVKAPKAVK